MKADVKRNIVSTKEEIIDIHLEFDPTNVEDERGAAIIAVIIDLVKQADSARKAGVKLDGVEY